jgi:ABC-type proline/glycine betaine transport system ATPase subunit
VVIATVPESAVVAGHALDIVGLTHRFGAFTAVDDVTLSIRPGEIVALLGPSGCGKTTLLRAVAGFIRQNQGRVLIDGASVDDLPPERRNIGIVFQNYALFPHMTVAQNVAYGMEARRRPRAEIRERVQRFLSIVQLDAMAERFPRQLSGGQQQRVALARALAIEPQILLLDEPFGALDKNLRLDMQIEVKRLQRQFGLTAIMVTHDQEEAMSIADRIAVMNRGRVEQLDTPVAIYAAQPVRQRLHRQHQPAAGARRVPGFGHGVGDARRWRYADGRERSGLRHRRSGAAVDPTRTARAARSGCARPLSGGGRPEPADRRHRRARRAHARRRDLEDHRDTPRRRRLRHVGVVRTRRPCAAGPVSTPIQ